jgi:CBS domain containing-hemolysin-like protein
MSARAAARLATLGFTEIYRYQLGKADWFAAGLGREGREASTARVADIAERDVPVCGLHDPAAAVRVQLRTAKRELAVVVDDDHVVLGTVRIEDLDDPSGTVEQIMNSGPLTLRPDLGAEEVPDYFKKRQQSSALVTTSDGVLIGLLRRERV